MALRDKIRNIIIGLGGVVAGAIVASIPNSDVIEEKIDTSGISQVESWKEGAKSAFLQAESEVFKPDPEPDPDVTPEPNPDKNKCPCKGSGWIVHGDGHKTPCPYHKDDDDDDDKKKHKCKCDTSRTYCNCVPSYGKCGCVKREASFSDEKECGPSG